MSDTMFTPGPWVVKSDGWGIHVQCKDSASGLSFAVTPICEIEQEEGCGGFEDANLIAASPDMYEALEHALSDMDTVDELCKIAGVHKFTTMRDEIENVLKKARGEQ